MHTERATAPVTPTGRPSTTSIAPRRVAAAPDLVVTTPAEQPDPSWTDARTSTATTTPQRRGLGLKGTMVLLDTVTTAVALVLSFPIASVFSNHGVNRLWAVALYSLPVWPALYSQQGLYLARHITRRIEELRRLVNAVLMGMVAMAGISVSIPETMSRAWLFSAGAAVFALVAVEREIVRQTVTRRRAKGELSRKVVLVGDNSEADELVTMLQQSRELGYNVIGRVSDDLPDPDQPVTPSHRLPYLGGTEEILDIVRAAGADSVVVATTGISLDSANRLVRDLTREGIYVELSSAMRDIATRRVTLRPLGRYPVMCVEPVTNTWRSVAKRGFDLIASTLGLLVISPILLGAAVAIRVTSGRGVLFTQTRVGRNGSPFTVYKLRTMVHGAESMLPELMAQNEAAGPMFKMADDPRVTKVGAFLRKTSIDELPQLLNVVKGDMSLVGPRPALPHEAVQWNDDLKERLRVKPGMTGNWQVNGRFTASIEDYQRLDLYYVDNWSLVSDLVILAKTIPSVLRRNGAA